MIYDRGPLVIYARAGSPTDYRLRELSRHYYARLEVFHRRFWESVQAGDRVDELVQVPDGEDLRADLYAQVEGGALYRINQAQQTEDDNGLPCCRLSLHREENNYELVRSGDRPEGRDP